MGSSGTWDTAYPSILPHWHALGRPFITGNPLRRWRPNWPLSAVPPMKLSSRCCLFSAASLCLPGYHLPNPARANSLRFPACLIPAWTPGRGILDRCADASRALDPDTRDLLRRSSWRSAAAARSRPRICARQLSRTTTGLLAGGGGFQDRRQLRSVCIGAGLHRSDLLGGIRPRARYCRYPPRDPCRTANGWNCGLRSAQPEFWSSGSGGAIMGARSAFLLARGRRGEAWLLVSACA